MDRNYGRFHATLLDLMNETLNESDTRELCIRLGTSYDNLGGNGLRARQSELIDWARRRGRLHDLITALRADPRTRHIAWPDPPPKPGTLSPATTPPGQSTPTTTTIAGDAYGPIGQNLGTVSQTFNIGSGGTDDTTKDRKNYNKSQALMPALLAAIKQDLQETPTFREFILKGENTVYNAGGKPFIYYTYEAFDDLANKVHILENMGFVRDVTFNNVPRYRLQENFVDLLLAD